MTNVFGERLWIEAADQGTDNAWGRWSMFTIDVRNAPAGSTVGRHDAAAAADLGHVLSRARRRKRFFSSATKSRTWPGASKRRCLWPAASADPAARSAKQTFNYLQALIPGGATPPPMAAAVRYQAMNSVPENWIPFIPVHVPNNNREIQLQRAAMPRILIGDTNPPQKVQPLTSLLRQGLDLTSGTDLFSARRRSAASRRPGDAVLLALALDARPGLHLVARAKADRTRRGLERLGFRSIGRQGWERGLTRRLNSPDRF